MPWGRAPEGGSPGIRVGRVVPRALAKDFFLSTDASSSQIVRRPLRPWYGCRTTSSLVLHRLETNLGEPFNNA